MSRPNTGHERYGRHRAEFESNRRKIFATQDTCGICGRPVDFSIKYPEPLAACIDHIIPIARGGHPSDINNLQLAHWKCNRIKSDKLFEENKGVLKGVNQDLPHTVNWIAYRSGQ